MKIDELSSQLILQTEVRWLPRVLILERVVDMFDSTLQFLNGFNLFLSDEINEKLN